MVIYLYSEPDLSFIINGNCLGSETIFINTSSSLDSVISYYWYLDEGFSSNQISPTHTYNQIGDYNISLLANTDETQNFGRFANFSSSWTEVPSPSVSFQSFFEKIWKKL